MNKRRRVVPFCEGCKSYHLQEHAKPGCDAFDEQEQEKDAVFAIQEMGRYKRERDKAEGRVKLLDDSLARMILQRDSERQTVRVLREKVSRLESEAKELQTTVVNRSEGEGKIRAECEALHEQLKTIKENVVLVLQGHKREVAELKNTILEKVDLEAKAIGDRAIALERAEEAVKERNVYRNVVNETRPMVERLEKERDTALRKLDNTKCNWGHDTLPLRLWDCPACHEITKGHLRKAVDFVRRTAQHLHQFTYCNEENPNQACGLCRFLKAMKERGL